ncbi:YceI family protein [Phenylobacterium sp.]|uniref:YceI family protein n=1 Tax=Phenylobacterium sp. TaxID=1871053 RepID=UPI003BABF689
MSRVLPLVLVLAALSACSPPPRGIAKTGSAAAPANSTAMGAQAPSDAPAGQYKMDLSHTSVNFRISHMGLSFYTARFTRMDGVLHFNPANPAAQSVSATIDVRSFQTNYPDPQQLDFDTKIENDFLGATAHPQITFKSTKVEPTGPRTARVTGDLTLKGVTKPVVLETTYNGGYKPSAMDPGSRVGFSAHGKFKRSDFGLTAGLPAPGTTLGVGDEIEVIIETEFTRAP